MLVTRQWLLSNAPSFAGDGDVQRMGDLSKLNPETLTRLQIARNRYGGPIVILCGYEDRKGRHGMGDAFDIVPLSKYGSQASAWLRLYGILRSMQWGGLGVYPAGRDKPLGYFHVDDRPHGPVVWSAWPEGHRLAWTDEEPKNGLVYEPGISEPKILRYLADVMEGKS